LDIFVNLNVFVFVCCCSALIMDSHTSQLLWLMIHVWNC